MAHGAESLSTQPSFGVGRPGESAGSLALAARSPRSRVGADDSAVDAPAGAGFTARLQAGASADSAAGTANFTRTDAPPDPAPASALPGMVASGLPGGAPAAPGATALAAGSVAGPAAAPNPDAAAVVEAFLAATPGQAEFAPRLGAQLTVFAREGIQFARLQVYPAELGPVWVQIQLEGQTAQVHLAAENAFTREQLGDALPALAGSLREAGLTLSGGGVFDQPRQRDAFGNPELAAGAAGARGGKAPEASEVAEGLDAALGALQVPLRRRGIVDLIA